MKEIREILSEIEKLPAGDKAVLATVVDLNGSGYRLPGARMLIKADGDAIGTVSGGCLEADVLERAKRVLAEDTPEVFTYDTTADENSVFSLNMGCRGVMRVLMEAVARDSLIVNVLGYVYRERVRIDSAVAISVADGSGIALGQRFFNGVECPVEEALGMMNDLETFAMSDANYQTIKYETAGGITEFAFESIRPPVQLFILGAGADAVPLADVAHGLGWEVNVCDHRPAFLTEERFPKCDALVSLRRDAAPEWHVDALTAFVVMNHNYDRDKDMLTGALNSAAFYVGALGPKRRTEQMLEELGHPFGEDQLAKLRSPAGLDIGGDTPEAIAISIIAEIQSVLRKRNGSPLRDRTSSIYDRK